MFGEILKAYICGICAAAPLGPVAIFILQKTLGYGHRGGFITAMGSTLIDTTYAFIAIFALSIVKAFIEAHQNSLLLVGGLILICVGISMAVRDPFRKMKEEDKAPSVSWSDTLQCSLTALSNPGAIFIMLALFAFFDFGDQPQDLRVAPLILAVAAGSATWWYGFTRFFGYWRNSFKFTTLMWVNRVSGIVVVIIGIALIGQGLYNIVF